MFEAEPEEFDLMRRPPRRPNAKIFDCKLVLLGLQQGTILFALLLAVYLLATRAGLAVEQARALTFSAMIIGDIWLTFINRSWSLPLHASVKRSIAITCSCRLTYKIRVVSAATSD